MLRDVVRRRRRRWAHAPVIHAASHFYHEKRVARVSISMHACDPVPIVMGLRYCLEYGRHLARLHRRRRRRRMCAPTRRGEGFALLHELELPIDNLRRKQGNKAKVAESTTPLV